MFAMLIPKPAQSAYENVDTDIREMLDRMIAELKATPSWEQRSTQFLEIIDALELAFEGDEDDAGDEFEDDEDDEYVGDDDDDDDDDDAFDDEDDEYVEEQTASGEKVNGWHGGGGVVKPTGDEDDEVEIVEDFAEVLPFYVGAVLEQLGETKIERPEQAAFYLLSCHPEHTEAAQSWLQQGSNLQRFQKFVDDTPDYEAILEMMDEHYDGDDDDDDDDEDEED
jgi:hypothetical protein